MTTTVQLPDELIAKAYRYGTVHHRSAPKQIEYWSRIGKIAEENPDLPYSFIKDILLARQEESLPFAFGEG
uniref:ParD-like antitoxin of type II toxin-antitoxin system n=1 Tax=Candidatus Kentrum sp. TC TaxID=2126339 RepID=A0A450YX94_9GAMM|nr:MAG: ParD-like antitoxin of type II toxin-antitoxin system [Candidatus Kentron sp. TC]